MLNKIMNLIQSRDPAVRILTEDSGDNRKITYTKRLWQVVTTYDADKDIVMEFNHVWKPSRRCINFARGGEEAVWAAILTATDWNKNLDSAANFREQITGFVKWTDPSIEIVCAGNLTSFINSSNRQAIRIIEKGQGIAIMDTTFEAVPGARQIEKTGQLIINELKNSESVKFLNGVHEYMKEHANGDIQVSMAGTGTQTKITYTMGERELTIGVQPSGMITFCTKQGKATEADIKTTTVEQLGKRIASYFPPGELPVKKKDLLEEIQEQVKARLPSVKAVIDRSFPLPILKFSQVAKRTVRVVCKDEKGEEFFVENNIFRAKDITQIVDNICSYYQSATVPTAPNIPPSVVSQPTPAVNTPISVPVPAPVPIPIQEPKGKTTMATIASLQNNASISDTTQAALTAAMTNGAQMAVVDQAYQLLVDVAVSLVGEYPFIHAFLRSNGLLAQVIIGLILPAALIFLCDNIEVPQKANVRKACLLVLEARTFTTLSPLLAKLAEPLKKLASVTEAAA